MSASGENHSPLEQFEITPFVLFEVAGVPHEEAIQALRLASRKLPIPTKTVLRDRLAAAVTNGLA